MDTYLSTLLVGGDATAELNSRLTLGLQVKFEYTKMVALAEYITRLLSKISIMWGSHCLK